MAKFTFESFFDRLVDVENKTGAIDAKFDGVQMADADLTEAVAQEVEKVVFSA